MDKVALIQVKNLFHKYEMSKENFVLNNLNFSISQGEFVTIVGVTGSGKSTLLKILLGAEKPFSGRALMNGKEIIKPNKDRGIVFQRYSLFEYMTVKQNVSLGLQFEQLSQAERLLSPFYKNRKAVKIEAKTNEYLEKVGLLAHANKHPFQLSGGMRQRAAIAQTLIMEPKVLLMDEPFGALDIGTREEMQIFVLEQWKRNQQTIIFVTHDLEEALFLGTRIIILSPYHNIASESGSKIVQDTIIEWPHPRSTKIKHTKEFNVLMESIRLVGLDPNSLLKIEQFNELHEDSIRLLK